MAQSVQRFLYKCEDPSPEPSNCVKNTFGTDLPNDGDGKIARAFWYSVWMNW